LKTSFIIFCLLEISLSKTCLKYILAFINYVPKSVSVNIFFLLIYIYILLQKYASFYLFLLRVTIIPWLGSSRYNRWSNRSRNKNKVQLYIAARKVRIHVHVGVFGVSIWSLRLFYWILEMFRQCGIFCFSPYFSQDFYTCYSCLENNEIKTRFNFI
jgi:hypothetical protein